MSTTFELKTSEDTNSIYEFSDIYDLANWIAFVNPDAIKQAAIFYEIDTSEVHNEL